MHRINVSLDDVTLELLEKVMNTYQLDRSSTIRLLINLYAYKFIMECQIGERKADPIE